MWPKQARRTIGGTRPVAKPSKRGQQKKTANFLTLPSIPEEAAKAARSSNENRPRDGGQGERRSRRRVTDRSPSPRARSFDLTMSATNRMENCDLQPRSRTEERLGRDRDHYWGTPADQGQRNGGAGGGQGCRSRSREKKRAGTDDSHRNGRQ